MIRAILLVGILATASTALADADPPVITHVRIEEAKVGEPLRIRAKIDDESGVFAPSVYVRSKKAGGEFTTIAMTKSGDAYEATIPADLVGSDLEYFVEAFDEQGNGPAREGSPEEPIQVRVVKPKTVVPIVTAEPPPPKPEEKSGGVLTAWWFWTIIGVAAAGGATALAIGLSSGSIDAVDIRVTGPAPEEAFK